MRKFFRNPSYTGFISLESMSPRELAAEDSDDASDGEGVVLALYYDEDGLPAPRPRAIH